MLRRQRVQEFITAEAGTGPAATTSTPAVRKGGPRKGGAAAKAVSAKA